MDLLHLVSISDALGSSPLGSSPLGSSLGAIYDLVQCGLLHAGDSVASAASTVPSVAASAADVAAHSIAHSAAPSLPPAGTPADVPPDLAENAMAPYLKYGPWAVLVIFILSGVGLHLSEDLILIPAGILIARGQQLPLWETLLAAYAGLIIGDLLWIYLCRRYGTKMVQSRWFKRIVHPRRLLEAKHQMERRGIIVVILARFIPGTRTPVITMAGILHMPWWKVITVELTTCAVTVPLQMGVGYLIGHGVGEAKSTGELVLKLAAACAVLVAVGFGIHCWIQAKKRKGRAPRSKAIWLRTFGRRRRTDSSEVVHQA